LLLYDGYGPLCANDLQPSGKKEPRTHWGVEPAAGSA